MDLYERAVELYLTEIKQCPIIPQFWVKFDMAGKACRPYPHLCVQPEPRITTLEHGLDELRQRGLG
jgi:hypothetical protein